MWRIPHHCLSILILSPSWYWTIWLGLLCAVLVFFVMCVAYRLRLRIVARATRARADNRLIERIHIARELQDTMLQTLQGSKFVVDAALEKSNDSAHMRLTLEKLSDWLGQAAQEGQAVLNTLRIATTETNDRQSSRKA